MIIIIIKIIINNNKNIVTAIRSWPAHRAKPIVYYADAESESICLRNESIALSREGGGCPAPEHLRRI